MNKDTKIIIITLVITFLVVIIGVIGTLIVIKNLKSETNTNKIISEQNEQEQPKQTEIDLYKDKAEQNAIKYIYEKYKFVPTIIDSNAEIKNDALFPTSSNSGNVFVELQYENKNFEVYINGESDELNGKDNYQYDKIVEDILMLIEKDINERPYAYEIKYGEIHSYISDEKSTKAKYINGMINMFYDGNNLEEVLKNQKLNMDLSYINNQKLEQVSYINSLSILNGSETNILNFKSYNDYNNRDVTVLNYKNSGAIYNAIYLKNATYFSNGKQGKIDCKLFESDGIYVFCQDKNNYDNVSIQKVNIDDVSNWQGHGFVNPKKSSSAYSIDGFQGGEKVYVYFPLSKINQFNIDKDNINPSIGIRYGEADTFYKKPTLQKIIGNYLVFNFEIKDTQHPNFEFLAIESDY